MPNKELNKLQEGLEGKIGDWFDEWNKPKEQLDWVMYLSWACFVKKKIIQSLSKLFSEQEKEINWLKQDLEEDDIRKKDLEKKLKTQEKMWHRLYENVRDQCDDFIYKCKKQKEEIKILKRKLRRLKYGKQDIKAKNKDRP